LSAIQSDHISISVEDLDKEIEWYGRVLGFKETNRMTRPPMTNVNLRNGFYRIDLIKYTGSKRTPAEPVYLQQGYVHLALSVPDIPAARAALMALDPDVKPGNGPAIVLKDPEGNEIEIFARK
jgi:catechol 2,3-dioxygenase-like lactoylglutathione lyase family enzyme